MTTTDFWPLTSTHRCVGILWCLTLLLNGGALAAPQPKTYDGYYAAIAKVESGGAADPDNASGDAGRALGRYQIWRAYWHDAVHRGKKRIHGGTYEDVRDPAYARQIIALYAKRYEPAAWRDGDWQTLARLHNGGPGWRKAGPKTRARLDAYWKKVREHLD